ncbi:MAG: hypothetical protein ACNYPD_05940 [Candidatus Halichondribacter symbioticus]
MSITFSGYEFEGPFNSTSNLKDQSGVYLILKDVGGNKFEAIYVGESEKVKLRIENNHERTNCWKNNNFTHFAAHYVTGENNRRSIETKIRQDYNPTCNRQ